MRFVQTDLGSTHLDRTWQQFSSKLLALCQHRWTEHGQKVWVRQSRLLGRATHKLKPEGKPVSTHAHRVEKSTVSRQHELPCSVGCKFHRKDSWGVEVTAQFLDTTMPMPPRQVEQDSRHNSARHTHPTPVFEAVASRPLSSCSRGTWTGAPGRRKPRDDQWRLVLRQAFLSQLPRQIEITKDFYQVRRSSPPIAASTV